MQVHRNSEQLPLFRHAVITIGTFDGVHTGHQQIIRQLREEAGKVQGESVIITFDPHPRKIIHGATKEIKLINTLDEKIELLEKNGIDQLVVIPFTEAFSQMRAEEYISEFLIRKFHPHSIIIGYDHRFGRGRTGNYELMEKMSPVFSYSLCEIPVHILNTISVSSTRIRDAIAGSDIETANDLLGYSFFFSGEVVEGNKLGRTIGYPTANLIIQHPEKLIPGNGVYAVEIDLEGSATHLKGMMNIGFRPTIDGTKKVIEVNIFQFDQSIYGQQLRIYVRKHLRSETKFSGLDALKEQLAEDAKNALEALR